MTTLIKLLILSFLFGCGVKGRPLPPEDKPELNRGRVGFELEGFKNQTEHERQNKKTNPETALDKSMPEFEESSIKDSEPKEIKSINKKKKTK